MFKKVMLPTSFIYTKSSPLLSTLNDASGDIIDDEGFLQFFPEAEFTSLLQVQITLEQTLKQNHRALHNSYNVKNMLKLLAFKWLLKQVIV